MIGEMSSLAIRHTPFERGGGLNMVENYENKINVKKNYVFPP